MLSVPFWMISLAMCIAWKRCVPDDEEPSDCWTETIFYPVILPCRAIRFVDQATTTSDTMRA